MPDELPEAKPIPDDVVRISHSMADTYNGCQRRFELAHKYNGKGLEPNEAPHALARGTFGHAVMAAFFSKIKEGQDSNQDFYMQAKAAAMQELMTDIILSNELSPTIMYWIETIWPTLGWKILRVEEKHYLKVGENVVFPFTLDLLIEENGEIVLVDHKFAADAYDADMLALYPQLPKYIGALRAEGIPVVRGKYNFLRTRSMKDFEKKIVITPVTVSTERIKNSFVDQGDTMTAILNHKGKYRRNISYTCAYCPFKDICAIEMRGDDATALINANYRPNTYSYDPETV